MITLTSNSLEERRQDKQPQFHNKVNVSGYKRVKITSQ
jgi:hypothetical protein